jgi:hypothetical protein
MMPRSLTSQLYKLAPPLATGRAIRTDHARSPGSGVSYEHMFAWKSSVSDG